MNGSGVIVILASESMYSTLSVGLAVAKDYGGSHGSVSVNTESKVI